MHVTLICTVGKGAAQAVPIVVENGTHDCLALRMNVEGATYAYEIDNGFTVVEKYANVTIAGNGIGNVGHKCDNCA